VTSITNTEKASVAMAEFSALRTEIATRTSSQNALANITVVAVGAIGGYAFGSPNASKLILLVLVPVAIAMGLLWLDHAHAIYKIGTYVRDRLWTQLRSLLHSDISTYEDYVLHGQPAWRERSVLILPFFILFVGPCLAALVVVARFADAPWTWAAWALEIIALTYFIVTWISFLKEYASHSRPAADDGSS
jgi:Fe2+ transport system protein B